MNDSNPYRSPNESSGFPSVKRLPRRLAPIFALSGFLFVFVALPLDATTFVPPRPLSADIAVLTASVLGIGLLLIAFKAQRR